VASKLRSSELYGIQAFNAMPDRLRQQRFRRDNSRVLERSYAAAAGDLMNMPKSDHRMVVLAVEDEPIVRMSLADFLDDAGFKVFEAVNADEAIALLQARSDVQVVVTDIEMPGSMNGLELARVVQVRWPDVGIVVTSGRVRPSTDDLMDGVVFLSKPYLPDAVISAIRQVTMPKHSN
jgi:CheY-like chemotaxis protein